MVKEIKELFMRVCPMLCLAFVVIFVRSMLCLYNTCMIMVIKKLMFIF